MICVFILGMFVVNVVTREIMRDPMAMAMPDEQLIVHFQEQVAEALGSASTVEAPGGTFA